MPMFACRDCKTPLSTTASVCPKCGGVTPSALFGGILAVAVFALWMLYDLIAMDQLNTAILGS